MEIITNETKIIVCKNAVAAGATDVTDATEVDMQNWEGVRFIFQFGAITSGAATSVAATGKATSGGTPGTDDLAGTKITVADTDDSKAVELTIHKPQHRYIRPFVKRATQNAVIETIIAELYGPKKKPVAKDSTVASREIHVSPANGTA